MSQSLVQRTDRSLRVTGQSTRNFPFAISSCICYFKDIESNRNKPIKELKISLFLKVKRSTKMNSLPETRTQSIVLTLPSQIVKEADSLFPRADLGALALMLLEKYLRYQKQKLLAKQYREYYQTLTDDDRAEEKQMLTDFASLEAEVNAFIEAEETNGSS